MKNPFQDPSPPKYSSIECRFIVLFRKGSFILVYDLGTQNLNFVAPIPEQVGTTKMHFSEVSGGTY